jgi:RimJ/RimL family protein N-acetyltransferase
MELAMHLPPPAEPLTDGIVTLRLPSVEAGDVEAVLSYIEDEQLDGGWLPEIPLVSAEQAIADWLGSWAGHPGRNRPTFVVTVPDEPRFIGIVGFGDRGQGVIEMIYGITPRWRALGLASRAARLAAQWAISQPGVSTVELRIDQDMPASQHVAANAGFVRAGTITQFVPGTGETFEDLRYVLAQPAAPAGS